jgi:hypothetical protein
MTAKRSYDYADYWIEVTVQPAGGRFEGAAAIFASRESAHGGQGPVHRVTVRGETEHAADAAAAARAEAWADGPGKKKR